VDSYGSPGSAVSALATTHRAHGGLACGRAREASPPHFWTGGILCLGYVYCVSMPRASMCLPIEKPSRLNRVVRSRRVQLVRTPNGGARSGSTTPCKPTRTTWVPTLSRRPMLLFTANGHKPDTPKRHKMVRTHKSGGSFCLCQVYKNTRGRTRRHPRFTGGQQLTYASSNSRTTSNPTPTKLGRGLRALIVHREHFTRRTRRARCRARCR